MRSDHRQAAPLWRVAGPAALALCLLAGTLCPGAVAAEPARAEYVGRLEQICKPGSEATQRAVRGVTADIRAERLRLAASKFFKARRIFAGTVSRIAKVPRPPAVADTLSRWFAALERETVYLGRTAAALGSEDVARFQRVSANFIHEGNKANNVVVSFGFNYCAFKPARFR